jgi:hypothetical protein
MKPPARSSRASAGSSATSRCKAEGIAQEARGEGQKTVGKVKETIKGVTDKVADKAHEKL